MLTTRKQASFRRGGQVASERFCAYEGMRFPASEFLLDPDYGWVHNAHPRHTTDGDLAPPSPPPNQPVPIDAPGSPFGPLPKAAPEDPPPVEA